MKKNLLILSIITLGFVFVGCDNNTAIIPERSSGDSENFEVIEIDFWHAMAGVHEIALENLIEEFHTQYPHIRVNAEFQGHYSDVHALVVSAAVAGTLPHLVQQTTENITRYIEDGIIMPLDQFIFDAEIGLSEDEIDDIVQVFREGVIWDELFMAIPFGKSTRVLYYNVDLFEEFGIDAPETWDELVEIAELLTDHSVGRYGMGFENSWTAEFIALTIQHGGEFIDEVTSTAMFGSDAAVNAAEFIMDLYDRDISRFAGEDLFLSGVFGHGGVAMYLGVSSSLHHVTAAVDNRFTFNTATLPTYNGQAAVRFQGNDLVMMENGMTDEEKLAAWTFMAFTMRPEITSTWAAETGYIPVTYRGRDHENFTSFLEIYPHAKAASDQFEAGFMTARVEGASIVWSILTDTLANIRLGLEEIRPALEDAQTRANEVLSN